MQEFFAVGTALFQESLGRISYGLEWSGTGGGRSEGRRARVTYVLGHNDGANHAGAQVALLAWGNEVFRHDEERVIDLFCNQRSRGFGYVLSRSRVLMRSADEALLNPSLEQSARLNFRKTDSLTKHYITRQTPLTVKTTIGLPRWRKIVGMSVESKIDLDIMLNFLVLH